MGKYVTFDRQQGAWKILLLGMAPAVISSLRGSPGANASLTKANPGLHIHRSAMILYLNIEKSPRNSEKKKS